MSLTANDVSWYSHEYDVVEIFLSYGNFPNVPLIGTRGYINYNLALALQQLGYPMEDKQDKSLVKGFIICEGDEDSIMIKMVRYQMLE